ASCRKPERSPVPCVALRANVSIDFLRRTESLAGLISRENFAQSAFRWPCLFEHDDHGCVLTNRQFRRLHLDPVAREDGGLDLESSRHGLILFLGAVYSPLYTITHPGPTPARCRRRRPRRRSGRRGPPPATRPVRCPSPTPAPAAALPGPTGAPC